MIIDRPGSPYAYEQTIFCDFANLSTKNLTV